MSKIVMRIGYKDLVLSPEAALAIISAIADAEVYEQVWHRGEDGASHYTHHVYPQNPTEKMSVEILSNELYRMAKLAGEPVRK